MHLLVARAVLEAGIAKINKSLCLLGVQSLMEKDRCVNHKGAANVAVTEVCREYRGPEETVTVFLGDGKQRLS